MIETKEEYESHLEEIRKGECNHAEGVCISIAHNEIKETIEALREVAGIAENLFDHMFEPIVDDGPKKILEELGQRRNKLREALIALPDWITDG